MSAGFLDINVILVSWPLVIPFVICRFGGKWMGTHVGGLFIQTEHTVKKYLPFTLLSHGGIVMGLALIIHQDPIFKAIGVTLVNVVIGATVINEIIGPALSRWAIRKANESQPPKKLRRAI